MKAPRFSLTYIQTLPHDQAWKLAWPMILSNMSVPLMGLADTAMLGHLESSIFLAAVAIGANIIALFYWMFAFLRMGTTSVTAQAMGANRPALAMLHLTQNAIFALVLGFALIAFQSLLLPMALWLIAPDEELLTVAKEYCQIRIFSAPAVLITYVATGWLLGQKKPKAPLIITVTANVINVVLDYLFIVHWQLEAKGAAYATLIAEYTACILSLLACAHYIKGKGLRKARWFDLKLLRENMQLSFDLFIRTTALLLVINFFNAQSALISNDVLAANAILFQCVLFIAFFLDGYALAAETMTARAIGAKNISAFHSASAVTLLYAVGISFCLVGFFGIFGSQIVDLLTDIKTVATTAKAHLFWLIIMPLVSVWCYALDGIFIGAGQAKTMRNTMLMAVFLGFFPVWLATRGLGNHGLWLAFVAFNGFRGVSLALAYVNLSLRRGWLNEREKDEALLN